MTMSYSQRREWTQAAQPGDYLAKYADDGLTADSDPGSRCGYSDDELAETDAWLRRRNLRLLTDDRGLVVASHHSDYTYTIFDANPAESSGTAWDTHQDVPLTAESDSDALDDVMSVLQTEAAGLSPDDEYRIGDRLYAIVWDETGVIVDQVSYTITAEDLGASATETDANE